VQEVEYCDFSKNSWKKLGVVSLFLSLFSVFLSLSNSLYLSFSLFSSMLSIMRVVHIH
jgi:hypothetical protein